MTAKHDRHPSTHWAAARCKGAKKVEKWRRFPGFLPFRSFCAPFRVLPSRRTLGSNEIPDLALVVSVPTVCFKNERYTSTHSLCSSLQRCKKWRNGEKKKEKKSALLSRTALLLRRRLDSFSRSAERSDISLLLFRVNSRCVST